MKIILLTILLYLSCLASTSAQEIVFSTYLNSSDFVYSRLSSVADKDGCIFVMGAARSGLEVTKDAFQKNFKGYDSYGGGDLFLMKLSPAGDVIYSTYIGGSGSDYMGDQIVMDMSGNVYLGFSTHSKDLRVSPNAVQKKHNNGRDYYVIKFSNDCKYLASSYLGGSKDDSSPWLAINNNLLYLIGNTKSEDFPITKGAVQDKFKKNPKAKPNQLRRVQDLSITALSLNLDKILFSTYLGGKSYERVPSFSFDKKGNLVLCGTTESDDYPTTKNAYDRSLNGKADGFITILNPNLTKIIYSTFIGGKGDDRIGFLSNDYSGNLIFTGSTTSTDFPITPDALKTKPVGKKEGFIMKMKPGKGGLVYSSFIGGTGDDSFSFVAQTKTGQYVLIGETKSKDFPITDNALDKTQNGPILKTKSAEYFSVTEDEIFSKGAEDLVMMILDKSLKKIKYSTFIGGARDDAWRGMVTAKLIKGNQLFISTLTTSHDFPTTHRLATYPGAPRNTLLKLTLKHQ
jgi:hypothetical protein